MELRAHEPHGKAFHRRAVRDHRVDRAQPRTRLAQGAGGQHEAIAEAARVHHGDLDVAAQPIVLQPIVEHEHVDILVHRAKPLDHRDTIGADPDRAAAAPREHDRLIADLLGLRGDGGGARRPGGRALAARHDRRSPAFALEVLGDPDDERRLAAAAGHEIADDDHRNAGMRARQQPQRVQQPSHCDSEAKHQAQRPQRPGERAATIPVAHYFADCVVNVIWERPASRAASMTRITAWCVALASALMTTIGSFAPAAARRSSSESCSTVRNGTGRRFTTYWPCAFTSTETSLARSGCFSASAALGRLICSSVYLEYVVVIMRKMMITIITSISGTRLISSGSRPRPRWKFIYGSRSPCSISTSLDARSSISTTKVSTLFL